MKERIVVTCGIIIVICVMYLVGLGYYEIWTHFDWEKASCLTAIFSIILAYIVGWAFEAMKGGKK